MSATPHLFSRRKSSARSGERWTWVRGRYKAHRPFSYRWVKGHAEGSGGLQKFVPGYYGQPSLNRPKPR